MEDWTYDELFETIQEMYKEFLSQNRGHRYAIARIVDDFHNLGELEDIIVDVAIGEILITHDKVFIGYIESIIKNLSMFNAQDAKGELASEEIKDLSRRIDKVIKGLKNAEVDYNTSAE
ncbi:Imm3 family immunity protein [Bacillus glycinifermentans]|uniref:Imm3 family immunity protein n=1 Tax=Bacillus glycinifermentans TaxID=1664069 RepID=UPI002DBF700A|nr:Imm3 family immunity protein [Bacillus glycinifermentans]MEC3606116.1 Imm3 family immunity protein [Bacillus glycinifermentans]